MASLHGSSAIWSARVRATAARCRQYVGSVKNDGVTTNPGLQCGSASNRGKRKKLLRTNPYFQILLILSDASSSWNLCGAERRFRRSSPVRPSLRANIFGSPDLARPARPIHRNGPATASTQAASAPIISLRICASLLPLRAGT